MVFLRIRRISLRPQPATRRASQRHYRRVPPSSAAFPGCPQSSYGVCPNHITSLTPVRKCFSVLPRWLISVRSSTHHFAYLFYHMDCNNSSFLYFFPSNKPELTKRCFMAPISHTTCLYFRKIGQISLCCLQQCFQLSRSKS